MKQEKQNSYQVCYYYDGIDTLTEHLFLSMVDNLTKLTASNQYISQYLFTTKNYVTKLVKKLEKGGYINITMVANQYRTITLTDKCVKIVLPKLEKTIDRVEETSTPITLSTTPITQSITPPNTNDYPPYHLVLPPIIQSVTNNIEYNIEDKIEDNIEDNIDNNIEEIEEVVEDITFDNSSPTKTIYNKQRVNELISQPEDEYITSLIKFK